MLLGDETKCFRYDILLSWNKLKVVPALLHAIPKLNTVY